MEYYRLRERERELIDLIFKHVDSTLQIEQFASERCCLICNKCGSDHQELRWQLRVTTKKNATWPLDPAIKTCQTHSPAKTWVFTGGRIATFRNGSQWKGVATGRRSAGCSWIPWHGAKSPSIPVDHQFRGLPMGFNPHLCWPWGKIYHLDGLAVK